MYSSTDATCTIGCIEYIRLPECLGGSWVNPSRSWIWKAQLATLTVLERVVPSISEPCDCASSFKSSGILNHVLLILNLSQKGMSMSITVGGT